MAVSAVVKDGEIQQTAAETSAKKATKSNSGMDKDAFLQLLVAQMKYQDPLEPTSNTEYISQYATFSQVEQMQNMASSMELSRASSMVGKLVEVTSTDSNGESKTIQGTVEYVTYENNKAYVSIDGTKYSAEDVTAVISEEYQSSYDLAVAFCVAMNKLPGIDQLTYGDKETVETLKKGYEAMTTYQKSFVPDDYVTKPFSPSELVARVDAVYRRVAQFTRAAEPNFSEELRSGRFVLNLRNRSFTKDGNPVELTQVEFQIMEYFISNAGKALKRSEILKHVWGSGYVGEEKIVDVNIRRLRMKIEDEPSNPRHVVTVWGIGYRWDK